MKLNTKFVPMPRNAFDLKAQRKMAQAINALRNNRMVIGSGIGAIHNSDQNTVFELPAPPSVDMVFPFKIYNIKNITATAEQRALFPPTVPPSADPVKIPSINDLTFQIRGGIVGARSYLTLPEAGAIDNSGFDLGAYGNFEQAVYCYNTLDTDPTAESLFFFPENPNTGGGVCTMLDNSNPTLIYGIPPNSPLGTAPTFSNQITLNPNVAGTVGIAETYNWSAAFWIQIVDDPLNGLYANLYGQMFALQNGDPSGRGQVQFPSGPNVIPLGWVSYNFVQLASAWVSQVKQYVSSNLYNRLPPTLGNQRGRWNEIYAALPAGSTHLVFYPGDIVVDDSVQITDPTSGFKFYRCWQMVDATPIFPVVAASPAGPDWAIIGMVDS